MIKIYIYCDATFDENIYLLLVEIHIDCDGNTYLLLVHLEGLHLLLLSSGPLECGDQKGIDDPFSELIDIERHLIRFHISSPQKDTQTQKHKDPKTQRHKDTKPQRHND